MSKHGLYSLLAAVGLLCAALASCQRQPQDKAVRFDVQRVASAVYAGQAAPFSEIRDDTPHPLPTGQYVVTNAEGEALLKGQTAYGTCRIYLFHDSRLVKRACSKASQAAGNVSCVEEGAAVFRECGKHVVTTADGEVTITGSWLAVIVLPARHLSLFVLTEGQGSVQPILDPATGALGKAVQLEAGQFYFTSPGSAATLADLPSRQALPLTALPALVSALRLQDWIEPIRARARADDVPFPDLPMLTGTPSVTPTAPPSATPTPEPSPSATLTPSVTEGSTSSPTRRPAPTRPPTLAATLTPSPQPTHTATRTPTRVARLLLANYVASYDAKSWDVCNISAGDKPLQLYSSDDPATLKRHVSMALDAGLDGFTLQWFAPGERTDRNFAALLAQSEGLPFYSTVIFLGHLYPDPSGASQGRTIEALFYLADRYRGQPNWLTVEKKPVIWFADLERVPRAGEQTPLQAWKAIRGKADPQGRMLWIAEGVDASYLEVFDGLYVYQVSRYDAPDDYLNAPRWARTVRTWEARTGQPKLWIGTLTPGWDDTRAFCTSELRMPLHPYLREREKGAFYEATYRAALQSDPDWLWVGSFNQWVEGSYIEPSAQYDTLYLKLTRQFAQQFKAP